MNDLVTKWLDNPDSVLTLKELYFILDFIQDTRNTRIIEEHFLKSYNYAAEESPRLNRDDMERIYKLIRSQINERETKRRRFDFNKLYRFFSRVAAVLIIPVSVLAVYGYLNRDRATENAAGFSVLQASLSKVEYFSPPGARTLIYLPDSSQVWLNGKSRLTVSEAYGNGKRDVALTGEAFFSVKKNREKPFNVYTNDAMLQVLGTAFNVSAYDDENCIEATLVSGEVNFIYEKENRTSSIKIRPSEKISMNRSDKKITTAMVDTQVYQSWKDGKIILRNHSLKQVTSILEKWFNVKISYDPNLEGYKFTATLDNKSLDQILMFISYSSPVNYTFENDSVHLTARK